MTAVQAAVFHRLEAGLTAFYRKNTSFTLLSMLLDIAKLTQLPQRKTEPSLWNYLKILHDQLSELAVCTDSTITAACRTGAGITPLMVQDANLGHQLHRIHSLLHHWSDTWSECIPCILKTLALIQVLELSTDY